jgi:hypothetical protein
MKTTKAYGQALAFVNSCKEHGFSFEIANAHVLRITKRFVPGDKSAFTYCDMFAYDVLAHAPLKGGSVWGTDGGSVGGMSGLNNGQYILNKSGEGARFMKSLAKLGGCNVN